MGSIDCVVVNWRTPGDLDNFCGSMQEQEISTLTIVNNQPTDDDKLIAEKWGEALGATVITNVDNIGYNRACNHAAQDTQSEYLALFNADVICPPGSVKAMVDFMEEHPRVGIAGPKQTNERGQITHAGIIGTNTKPRHRGWKQPDRGQFDDVLLDVVTVSGSAYFVRRGCWDDMASCETYRAAVKEYTGEEPISALLDCQHFWGETWMSYHARSCGDWKVAYNGRVQLTHLWQRASPNGPNPRVMAGDRSLFRFTCDRHKIARD